MIFRNLSIALATVLTLGTGSAANARSWSIVPDRHSQTEASFSSKALIVKFSGRTTKVDGKGEIDVDNPSRNPKGEVLVDLTSLDTGIALRNEHMRGMIQADKHPTARFVLKALKAPKLAANAPIEGTVTGDLTISGVTRTIQAPTSLVYLPESDKDYRPGDWVAVSTEFPIKLSDYGIMLPKGVLGLKVSDEIVIHLDGMAKAI